MVKVKRMSMDIWDTYEIIGKIGSGNTGEIYKAYHKNLGKEVVLKKIKTEVKDIVNNRGDVDVLKNLRHSCLPQVLDFLNVDGDVYTVMDYIPGNSFKQYLDAGTKFPEKSVIIWTKQICATLNYLHTQKPPIIHSDLKPGNIMLMPDGNICLIDFNISSSPDGASAWVTGYTGGYAAPEQVQALKYNQNQLDRSHWKTIDVRADIYGLGATVYHLLTGNIPQTDDDGYVEDIRSCGIKVNDIFASIIMKCLEPNPDRRYQSAEDLLLDLRNMKTKDKRYKELLLKQKVSYAAVICAMIICAGITVIGYFRMDVEKQKQYEQLVRKEAECISTGDYDSFETYFQRAVNLVPERADAYYQKALALYRQRQYGDSIDFINSEILSKEDTRKSTSMLNNVYYLLGNSYEKMESYKQAAACYEQAIELKPDNSDYYRDYAIALAYSGRDEEAKTALENARKQGLDSVEIDYVQGEIFYNSSDYSTAKDIFLKCLDKAEDAYIKMRSCIMVCKCVDNIDHSVSGNDEKIQLLEKARKELPKEYNIGVLEQLAQAYSDMAADTGDVTYNEKAIAVFEQIQEQGMGSYDTDYNLSVLYQNIQDYARAAELLTKMISDYGENYKTYKALAFLEIAKQSQTVNEQRNYETFRKNYLKAEELYQKQLENNANDVEMERLKELYDQAVQNGWLKG
ncbi:MAG: protein kinase [Eubacteriales bacterium]|nr:protein kinase [Eubacteriales bacterium]